MLVEDEDQCFSRLEETRRQTPVSDDVLMGLALDKVPPTKSDILRVVLDTMRT